MDGIVDFARIILVVSGALSLAIMVRVAASRLRLPTAALLLVVAALAADGLRPARRAPLVRGRPARGDPGVDRDPLRRRHEHRPRAVPERGRPDLDRRRARHVRHGSARRRRRPLRPRLRLDRVAADRCGARTDGPGGDVLGPRREGGGGSFGHDPGGGIRFQRPGGDRADDRDDRDRPPPRRRGSPASCGSSWARSRSGSRSARSGPVVLQPLAAGLSGVVEPRRDGHRPRDRRGSGVRPAPVVAVVSAARQVAVPGWRRSHDHRRRGGRRHPRDAHRRVAVRSRRRRDVVEIATRRARARVRRVLRARGNAGDAPLSAHPRGAALLESPLLPRDPLPRARGAGRGDRARSDHRRVPRRDDGGRDERAAPGRGGGRAALRVLHAVLLRRVGLQIDLDALARPGTVLAARRRHRRRGRRRSSSARGSARAGWAGRGAFVGVGMVPRGEVGIIVAGIGGRAT